MRQALLPIVAVLAVLVACGQSSAEDWRTRDNSTMAYRMTMNWVKERLRAPNTAKFPGITERRHHVTSLGDRRYRIRSYVDAQNAFGATIRTHFSAEVEQTGESDWRLLSLNME